MRIEENRFLFLIASLYKLTTRDTSVCRLLLIVNLTKYTLREREESLESKEASDALSTKQSIEVKKKFMRKSFWSNPNLVSEKYMFGLLCFIHCTSLLISLSLSAAFTDTGKLTQTFE
jgi:hypothetical protein